MKNVRWLAQVFVFVVLLELVSNYCGSSRAISEEIAPTGVIIIGPKFTDSSKNDFQCFVPARFDDRYVLLTTTDATITSESSVGIKVDRVRMVRTSLAQIVVDPQKLIDNATDYQFKISESGVCFFPLVEAAPPDELAKLVWTTIRQYAIDMNSVLIDTDIPSSLTVASYFEETTDSFQFQAKETKVGNKEALPKKGRLINSKGIHFFNLDSNIRVSECGAPVFRSAAFQKEDEVKNFVGMCVLNTYSNLVDETQLATISMLDTKSLIELYKINNDPAMKKGDLKLRRKK